MLSINHTSTPVVRLALLGREAKKQKKILYITDSGEDIFLLRTFARDITGHIWDEVSGLGEYWNMLERESGYFFMSSDVLRYTGNLVHLERASGIDILRGESLSEQACIERLIEMGYTHGDATDTPGTYNKSGGTLIIRDALLPRRVVCEWFDTELDSIILYEGDARTHRANIRINTVPERIQLEKGEKLNPVLVELIQGKKDTSSRHIDEGDILLNFREHGSRAKTPPGGQIPSNSETLKLGNSETIIVSGCDFIENKDILLGLADIHMGGLADRGGMSVEGNNPDIPSLLEFAELLKSQKNISIYTRYPRTVEDFFEYNSVVGVPVHEVASARLTSGMWIEDGIEHYIIADDILGQIFVKKRAKKSIAKHLDLLLSLSPGDYVVHREHGIALFHAVVKKSLGDIEREYIELHYAEGDKLFVPLTEIYRISRYIGENSPELTRLSGTEWERTMDKTNEEIEAIAMDILETSAKRTLAKGRAFSSFPSEEQKFQEAFAYEYTLDQKTAIDEIFADMESENPMDRLVSGDVGFGKTEVAMNAIYKAVLSGTQVAVLSPLLVLADEHYETFCERLSPFGVRVGVLTRMSSPSEVSNTLDAMRDGNIDVVVGTHRLISDDIVWKRLGLLIIDEEHKFGVTHKEKIKKIKANLDILALSATPIPRSLNLALSGLKKISLLTTPPRQKKPIETIVTKWNESVIRDAIMRELERGGQTIIIHNRIRGMESIANELEMILEGEASKKIGKDNSTIPGFGGGNLSKNSSTKNNILEEFSSDEGGQHTEEQSEDGASFSSTNSFGTFATKSTNNRVGKRETRFPSTLLRNDEDIGNQGIPTEGQKFQKPKIIITHGQMPAEHIEERIHAFKKREYNILLTTTIIENGVNFLSANTIIIIDPEEFGLASLHQLRGRVGRKDIAGTCYLIYRKPELAGDEKERLITIANNTHLGAGFEIAMRDMEIRGAGDVLGIKQAGKSKDVGLTLYFRMLEEKISELKEAKKTRTWTKIELELSYLVPDELFSSETDKLSFYREIENIETLEELEEIEEELRMKSEKGRIDDSNNLLGLGEKKIEHRFPTMILGNDGNTGFFVPQNDGNVGNRLFDGNKFSADSTSPGQNQEDTNISNLFLLLRTRIILSEYGVTKVSKVGMNYVFELREGIDVREVRNFLERFDTRKIYTLLSTTKIRVETRYYRGVAEFLGSLR